MNLKPWQLKLFYLILFLIPSNLAYHFILPSSYIAGHLIDYLIPTLYLTDILILILIFNKGVSFVKIVKSSFFIFMVLLIPSIIFSASPIPAFYKWLKLLELSLFAVWIKQHISLKKHLNPIINTLSASVLFQSLLALTQWFKQSSIFGYWFLGEQPYNSATYGIDKITWFTHAVKIPPMGTFPHPNILGGFLATILPLLIYQLLKGSTLKKHKIEPYWIARQFHLYVPILLGLTTLFLTFSLSAWLAFLLIGLPLVLKQKFKVRNLKFTLIYSGFLLILLSIALNFEFLAPQSSFTRRSELSKIAFKMFKNYPLTGVGLNNFTIKMEQYGHIIATTRFLQPVHNIYLLTLSETGLIGFSSLLYLLFNKGVSFVKKSKPFLISLLTILFLGLFDHYPFTIQQGLLLFFIFLSTSSPTLQSPKPPSLVLKSCP